MTIKPTTLGSSTEPQSVEPRAAVTPPPKNYLSNKDLLEEVKKSKAAGQMSDKLARQLQLLCSRYAKKGSFVNYTYNEDMQGYAMYMLVRTWNAFDPAKSSNPFAFFTQCIRHSFIQFLNQEKRQRNIRDILLVDQGMTPSFGFTEDGSDLHVVEDEEDFTTIHQVDDLYKKSSVDIETIEIDVNADEDAAMASTDGEPVPPTDVQ